MTISRDENYVVTVLHVIEYLSWQKAKATIWLFLLLRTHQDVSNFKFLIAQFMSLIYSISITTLVKKKLIISSWEAPERTISTWNFLMFVRKKFRNLLELLIFSFQARGQSFSSSTVRKS